VREDREEPPPPLCSEPAAAADNARWPRSGTSRTSRGAGSVYKRRRRCGNIVPAPPLRVTKPRPTPRGAPVPLAAALVSPAEGDGRSIAPRPAPSPPATLTVSRPPSPRLPCWAGEDDAPPLPSDVLCGRSGAARCMLGRARAGPGPLGGVAGRLCGSGAEDGVAWGSGGSGLPGAGWGANGLWSGQLRRAALGWPAAALAWRLPPCQPGGARRPRRSCAAAGLPTRLRRPVQPPGWRRVFKCRGPSRRWILSRENGTCRGFVSVLPVTWFSAWLRGRMWCLSSLF